MHSLSLLACFLASADACTTIIAGRLATSDGSVMCTHSNDGAGTTDPRLVRVPAQDYANGRLRPVYWATEEYPRYVGWDRHVAAYTPVGLQKEYAPIGYIPQVNHTFAYLEQTYGAINEHQVGIGESTCSGVFGTKALGHGGQALLSIDTLSQLAMERATSARSAVMLMGALAEQYGFYGEGSFEGSAESLMVTDPNEGFIFHILPDDSGRSAIWAAQRVADDQIGVVANVFVIRHIDASDPQRFLFSKSVYAVAQRKGWWSPDDGMLDFTAVYSDGEYAHKYYSGRRVWGVYHALAPSLQLSPSYGEWRKDAPYPVTVKPDRPVTVADLAAAMRSYYEGTPFDQTQGLAAGPWGTPDHVASSPGAESSVSGNWERTIGLFRTSDSHIVQSRRWLPNAVGGVLWWGPHAAPYTVYVPFSAGMDALPDCTLGHHSALEKASLFWAVRYLANIVQLKRSYAIKDVEALQAKLHARGLDVQAQVDRSFGGSSARSSSAHGVAHGSTVASANITGAYHQHADAVVKALWAATDALMFKYADGWINEVRPDGSFSSKQVDAPDWWLRAVNYTQGPPPVPTKTPA